MSQPRLIILILLLSFFHFSEAQVDTTIANLQQIPVKYISSIENKIDKYSNRISSKTEKTLAKLSRWENKIKSMLEKVNPETAARLFSNSQLTFSAALQKLKEGKTVVEGYKTKYNEYRDKLNTSIKYLDEQKDKLDKHIIKPVNSAKKKLAELEEDVSNTEAVEQFIKERKKQLINEAAKYIDNEDR
jgi:flagellar capping protein FliD